MNPAWYTASLKPLEDAKRMDRALACISPERRRRALDMPEGLRRRQCVGAELLLRRALEEHGLDASVISYTYGPHGKPYLASHPGVFFSLSHSAGHVICALGSREVGCDIEQIRPVDLRLARRFFDPMEYEDILAAGSPQAQLERFFWYWTLKESFLKACGKGLHLPMKDFRIQEDAGKIAVQTRTGGPAFSFFSCREADCCCALCSEADCETPELVRLDLGEVF